MYHTLMNKNLMNSLGILIGGVFIAGAFFFFSSAKNSIPAPIVNELQPESAITHGHGLAVDVADPSKLYIATHHGLLVLVDERDLFRIGASHDDYMGFSIHPTNAQTFFSSGHPQAGGNIGFQQSIDGGFTWQKVSQGINGPVDFHAMTVSPVNPNRAYGWYRGNLQRTEDAGKTWEIVNSEVLAVYLAADSQDDSKVYAATPDGEGVMLSIDRGATWSPLSPALAGGAISVISVHPKDNKVLLVFSEKLGGLAKSLDSGKTWKKIEETFDGETVLHVAFNTQDPTTLYALTHQNALYKSTDAGDSWKKIR